MHPLTFYEIAVREHERATAQRVRTSQQALQRQARTTSVRVVAERAARRPRTAPARVARGAV